MKVAVYALEYEILPKKGQKYYIGQSKNPLQRIKDHVNGYGATATKRFGVKRIVDIRWYPTRSEAVRAEKRAWAFVRSGEELADQPCCFTPIESLRAKWRGTPKAEQ